MFGKGCKEGVHKYEGRYEYRFNDRFMDRVTDLEGRGIVDSLKEKIYIHDICVRCGKIIKGER